MRYDIRDARDDHERADRLDATGVDHVSALAYELLADHPVRIIPTTV